MILSAKFFIAALVILAGGFLCYTQFLAPSGLVVLSASSSLEADGAGEILQLENIIRNITNATVQNIGTFYSECKKKDVKTGSVMLRKFGNDTREVWLVLQLNPPRGIEGGLINVRLFYNSKKLFATHFDLCKKFLPSVKCPLLPQRQTYALRYPMPRFILPGKYGFEAQIVDQKDETLACLTSEISL